MIENRLMTVRETAEYLRIGINKCYKLCKKSDFPVCKIGKQTFIDKKILDEVWIPNKLATSLH